MPILTRCLRRDAPSSKAGHWSRKGPKPPPVPLETLRTAQRHPPPRRCSSDPQHSRPWRRTVRKKRERKVERRYTVRSSNRDITFSGDDIPDIGRVRLPKRLEVPRETLYANC